MIIEKWKNVQAYEIGKLHISRNMVCQDRTHFKEINGVKIVSLADGAGSKSKSEMGAEIVCEKICELLSTKFIDYLLCFEDEKTNQAKHKKNMMSLSKEIISFLMTVLKEKALEMNIAVEELSSTLLFFAIKDNHYIMGHIGDGVIAGLYNEILLCLRKLAYDNIIPDSIGIDIWGCDFAFLQRYPETYA